METFFCFLPSLILSFSWFSPHREMWFYIKFNLYSCLYFHKCGLKMQIEMIFDFRRPPLLRVLQPHRGPDLRSMCKPGWEFGAKFILETYSICALLCRTKNIVNADIKKLDTNLNPFLVYFQEEF